MPSVWPLSRYEIMQGHAGTIQSREFNLVDQSWQRRRPRKVPGIQGAPVRRQRAELSCDQRIKIGSKIK